MQNIIRRKGNGGVWVGLHQVMKRQTGKTKAQSGIISVCAFLFDVADRLQKQFCHLIF